MPFHDLVFLLLIILTVPIAFCLVTWTEHNQRKKSTVALDDFKNTVRHFMTRCIRSRQSGKTVLKIEGQPIIQGVPKNMHVHSPLGTLKMYFRGGIPTAHILYIGSAATGIVAFIGLTFYMAESAMTPAVHLVLLLIFLIVWCYLLVIFALFNEPIILFYEYGLILMEKHRLAGMRATFQRTAPFSDLYGIEVSVHAPATRSEPFYWLCQITFNSQPPFCLKGNNYRSLYQLICCFNSASFYSVGIPSEARIKAMRLSRATSVSHE